MKKVSGIKVKDLKKKLIDELDKLDQNLEVFFQSDNDSISSDFILKLADIDENGTEWTGAVKGTKKKLVLKGK